MVNKRVLKLAILLVLAVAAVAVIVALGASLGWWATLGRVVQPWFWGLLPVALLIAIVAAVGAAIVALRRFLPRYWEQRFMTRQRSGAGQTMPDGEEAWVGHLEHKLQHAVQTIEKAAHLRQTRGMPLYAVPWYLLIGAGQSGKTTLLHGVADVFAPFVERPSQVHTPTQDCDWWFFNTAVILDTAGRYALPIQPERDTAQWYRFLQLLRSYRHLQPLNGLIIAVAADALATKRPAELRQEATELRQRVDEAIGELGVDFPVYVLVTRCDTMEGFTEFFSQLPEQALQQVFGYVHDTLPQGDHSQSAPVSPPRFEAVGATLVERLQHLRLSLFNEEKLPEGGLRQRLFCFTEEFRALQQPLTVFMDTLLAESPLHRTPSFRGVFFSSAQQQGPRHSFLRQQLHFNGQGRSTDGATKPYFLHDFFAVILPRDRYLVQPTRRAVRGRLWQHLFGFAGCVIGGLLLMLSLTQAFVSDRRVRSAVNQESCATAAGEQGREQLLASADGCRQEVQTLLDRHHQRFSWGKLVSDSSGTLASQLRQRYVEKFATEVLVPLDAALSQRLSARPDTRQRQSADADTIPMVFMLIKRLELLDQCLSLFGCPEAFEADAQPDYQLMLAVGRAPALAPGHVTRLRDTYEAYLRWASPDTLGRERDALAERLRQWFAAKQFALSQILPWANHNQQYAPVTAQAYWEGVPATEGRRAQVDGVYTPKAWQQSIFPFLQRAGEAVPDMAPLLKKFQDDYRLQYFEHWRRFLAEFPRGEALSREQRRRLAMKLLDENSPYDRIMRVTAEHLKPFLPETLVAAGTPASVAAGAPEAPPANLLENTRRTVRQWWQTLWGTGSAVVKKPGSTPPPPDEPPPPWVALLLRYLGSESRKDYLATMRQMRDLLAENVAPEKSFQFVQTAFQDGAPSEKSTHPLLKAWGIMAHFRQKEGTKTEEEKAVLTLLERPVAFVWRVFLEGASEFLQKSWAEKVIAPTRGLSEMEQVQALYGPQGKVREFVTQFMKPFLVDNESRLGRVLDQELPIASAFLKTLRDEKQLQPILAMGKHPVTVEALRAAEIEAPTLLSVEKTEFSVECDGKQFKTSYPTAVTVTIPWAPGSCGEVTLTTFVACEQFCVRRAADLAMKVPTATALAITKRYAGPSGLLDFIKHCQGKSAIELKRNDFVNTEGAQTYRIDTIRVFYRVAVPESLSRLLALVPSVSIPQNISR